MKLQLQNQAQHICMLSFIYTYLPNKKKQNSAASQTVATARIAPKICQASPQRCARFHTNRFTFGGVIAECVNTVFDP